MSFFVIIIWRIVRRADAIPDISDHMVSQKYHVSIPCSNQELDEAISIADFYFRGHTINPGIVRKNRELNKYFTVTATDNQGEVKGFLDLFCLEQTALEYLIRGVRTESDLTASDVVAYKPGHGLYIGGFAISYTATKIEKEKIYYSLIYGMLLMLKKKLIVGQENLEIYAIGYSKPGIKAITRMGVFFPFENTRLGKETPPFRANITGHDIDEKLKYFRVARVFCRVKIDK